MRKVLIGLAMASALLLTGCDNDAIIASRNLSQAADNFQITRRIVFVNGMTDTYLLSIEGRCSFDVSTGRKLDVTCKTGPNSYKKHSLGLSDNVTYFSEQLEGVDVSVYRYKVVFKPSAIIPDVNVKLGF
jgi:hypothetical protein